MSNLLKIRKQTRTGPAAKAAIKSCRTRVSGKDVRLKTKSRLTQKSEALKNRLKGLLLSSS